MSKPTSVQSPVARNVVQTSHEQGADSVKLASDLQNLRVGLTGSIYAMDSKVL